MNLEEFRTLCLSFDKADEVMHFDKPSFRFHGKIFATLHLDTKRAVLLLSVAQQQDLIELNSLVFYPVPNKWGEKGATFLDLEKAKRDEVEYAVKTAWQYVVNKK